MKYWFSQLRDIGSCAWRLRGQLRPGRYLVAAVFFGLVATAALEGIGVSLLVPLLTLMLGGDNATSTRPLRWLEAWLPNHSASYYAAVFCVFIAGAIALKNIVLYASQVLSARLKMRVSVNLRNALFQQLHRADIGVFERSPAGELANLFLTDTVRSSGAIDSLMLLAQRTAIGLFYLAALIVISWPLTLLTVVLAALIGGSIVFLYRRLTQRGSQVSALYNQMSVRLVESFAGVRVIRTTNSQEHEARRFNAFSRELAEVEASGARAGSLLGPVAETVAVLGAMIIVASAYFLLVRPGYMPNSFLLAYGFVLLRLLPLLNQLYSLQGSILYMAGGIREIERWMKSLGDPPRPFGKLNFARLRSEIRFRNVSYVYPNGKRALSQVDFEIPSGKTVAIVGASGSGKSTLATLLLRLREPAAGSIAMDGIDHWEFTAESWHRAIGIVEQDCFLFHDTIENNVAYGYPEASAAEIEAALRMAQLDDFVRELPEGLQTLIGERGVMLSGGQRQRLAIARALVRNPQILILDEATSALDTLSEYKVQMALDAAMKGRTVLVIAHRLSTIRTADELVVMSDGKVVERGTWKELERHGEYFAALLHAPSAEVQAC